MNKSAVAAAAVLGVSALTSATVLPGSAASDSALRTRNLVLHATADRDLGTYSFAGTDVIKSKGKVVGYDSLTGRFFPKREKVVVQVAFALKGGIIVGRVSNKGPLTDSFRLSGPILKGSGKYNGISGRINARSSATSNDTTFVTLRYTL